jgi:hypothetical protein
MFDRTQGAQAHKNTELVIGTHRGVDAKLGHVFLRRRHFRVYTVELTRRHRQVFEREDSVREVRNWNIFIVWDTCGHEKEAGAALHRHGRCADMAQSRYSALAWLLGRTHLRPLSNPLDAAFEIAAAETTYAQTFSLMVPSQDVDQYLVLLHCDPWWRPTWQHSCSFETSGLQSFSPALKDACLSLLFHTYDIFVSFNHIRVIIGRSRRAPRIALHIQYSIK